MVRPLLDRPTCKNHQRPDVRLGANSSPPSLQPRCTDRKCSAASAFGQTGHFARIAEWPSL